MTTRPTAPFTHDTYDATSGMRIDGAYDGALVAGESTTIHLDLVNVMSETVELVPVHGAQTLALEMIATGATQPWNDRGSWTLQLP